MATNPFAQVSITAGATAETVDIRVRGELDAAAAATLQRVVNSVLDDEEIVIIQVHLDRVQGANEETMSGLGPVARRAARRGVELTLINPPELLCAALEAEELTELIRIVHADRRPPWSVTEVGRRSGNHPSEPRPVNEGPDSGWVQGI